MRRLMMRLFRRRNLERELEAELAFHREMAAARGNTIPLGNATLIAEDALAPWRFRLVENLWRDLKYGIRGLRRSPALVLTAVVSLALGIGVNTAMFSLGVEFLLSEPSVADAKSVALINIAGNSHAPIKVVEALRDSGIFHDVTGENGESFINWNDGEQTRRIFGVTTTRNYFAVLAPPMAYGRGYAPSDPKDVVVLCHRFWQRQFGGDPSIVGRSIQLDGRFYTVMGILPQNHRTLTGFGFSPDVYIPYILEDTYLAVYARLRPGTSIEQARAGLSVAATRLNESFPDNWRRAERLRVRPIAGVERLRQERELVTISLFFVVLLVIVGLVLLIACVNVASLLLARASARRREIAIRLSLGAGRYRLLQQLLVESLLLSVLGAAAGFALAQLTVSAIARIQLPLPFPIRLVFEPDWRVVTYAAMLTVIATLACGLLPAFQSLKESLMRDFHVANRFRLRRALVAGQIAISVIVLTTGVLFLRNLSRSAAISPGFDVRRTLRAEAHLPPAMYKGSDRVMQYAEEGVRVLSALPGIESAAAARIVPFTDATTQGTFMKFVDGGDSFNAHFRWNTVTPAFFRTMDIPILSGRAFLESDRSGAKVVVVSRTFVQRYSPDKNPIGRTFLWEAAKMPCLIVGVVEDTKNMTIGEDPEPQLYQPLAQTRTERTRIQFVLRSSTPPATQLDAVRQALRQIEPGAGLEVATLYSSIGLAFLPSQVGAALLGSMGVLGLVLAAVGLYGVMVYSVTRRTREIGVRMAIGANRRDISKLVLVESARLIAFGSVIGLLIAFFVTKPLAMFLVPGIRPSDPASFSIVVLVLLGTGLVATWSPARRAATIDPMISLRCD